MTPISAQSEKLLDEVVRNGNFKSRDEALSEALRLLREKTESDDASDQDILPPEDWVKEFDRWARSHTKTNPTLDDSRESIYGGRGK